jgi:hypothetical protein
MRPVLLSAVSVAGKFVGSIGSLELRSVACGFNEMSALCAPALDNVETPALSPLGERVDRRRRFLQPGRAG